MAAPQEFRWPEAAGAHQALRGALESDGIFVVRDLLGRDEIAALRAVVKRHLGRSGRRLSLGRTQPNAAVMVPELAPVFAHPRILGVMKAVLGEEQLVFTGHCDIHMNMLSGWHKDSGETVPGGYFRGPYMTAPDCRVYKVAIYLQDSGRRDGFTCRLGSHRETDLTAGEAVKVATRAGDIVVFDVRLTHTGQLPDPVEKALKGLSLAMNGGDRDREDAPWVSRAKALYWKLIGRRDRLSIFFTYGAPNDFTYDFASANMARQERQGAAAAGLPEGLQQQLQREDIAIGFADAAGR